MATPNLFIKESSYSIKHGEGVPGSTDLEILYVTDRKNNTGDEATATYGQSRSSSASFGEAVVKLSTANDWEKLRDASDGQRGETLVNYGGVVATEHGAYPSTPYPVSYTHLTLPTICSV